MHLKRHLFAALILFTPSFGQDCTANGGDCRETRCCQDADSRCFLKDAGWASCNATCSHDAIWNETSWARAVGEHVWDCTELVQCSGGVNDGEDCRDSKCCANPGSKCFKKDAGWASCNATCNPYALYDGGWIITNDTVWDCTMLMPGNQETTPQPESEEEACAPPTKDGEDCRESMSCENPDSKCFVKNNGWASCNATCSPNFLWVNGSWQEQNETIWNCTELVTACVSSTTAEPSASPVLCSELNRTEDGQNCSADRLCANPDSQCYRKNLWWSSCNASCAENKLYENGSWITVDEEVWDCAVLTPDCVNDTSNDTVASSSSTASPVSVASSTASPVTTQAATVVTTQAATVVTTQASSLTRTWSMILTGLTFVQVMADTDMKKSITSAIMDAFGNGAQTSPGQISVQLDPGSIVVTITGDLPATMTQDEEDALAKRIGEAVAGIEGIDQFATGKVDGLTCTEGGCKVGSSGSMPDDVTAAVQAGEEAALMDEPALVDASAIAAPQQPVLPAVQGVMMCALAAMLVSAAGTWAFFRRPTVRGPECSRLISDNLTPEE